MSTPQIPTKILVVDDSVAIRNLLCAVLRNEGYNVVGDMTGSESFIQTVQRLEPDIICLDQNMPGVDGLTLLRRLHESYPLISVVMISGTLDLTVQREAVTLGIAGFLKKPFSQSQIVDEIKQVDHARKLLKKANDQEAAFVTGVCVVVADDSSSMRLLLTAILENMGLAVVGQARDGQEALKMVTQFKPHAICLDLEMPNMDGLQAMAIIRKEHPGVKVIIVSSSTDKDKVKRAIVLGASGYIIKPFEQEKVVRTMQKLLLD
jgi:CheY-like chemotaxis protein